MAAVICLPVKNPNLISERSRFSAPLAPVIFPSWIYRGFSCLKSILKHNYLPNM